MNSAPVVEREQFESADDFLDALSPRNSRWQKDSGNWVFRGQSDAGWGLVASAHRRGAFNNYALPSEVQEAPSQSWVVSTGRHEWILREFARTLDDLGLRIPSAYGFFDPRQSVMLGGDISPQNWPLMALAQHHGLPTPLLDWSRSARVAAYFASNSPPLPAGDLAVWGLRIDRIPVDEPLANKDIQPDLHLRRYRAPSSDNPNMFAQDGMFTHLSSSRGDGLDAGVDTFFEDALVGRSLCRAWDGPTLRKLILPRSGGPALMRLLRQEGVSAGRLFPGVDGAALDLKERLAATTGAPGESEYP